MKVVGKISYEDGSRIEAHRITLTFEPQTEPLAGGAYPPSGVAEVNVADGTFDNVTSHKYGDGIVPGKHKVVIHTYDEQDNPIVVVAPEYADRSTTPLLVDTAETTQFQLVVSGPGA